jgi:hypothetical protein
LRLCGVQLGEEGLRRDNPNALVALKDEQVLIPGHDEFYANGSQGSNTAAMACGGGTL